ncbi:MAG: nodB, partial [Acidimicrobiales bacterium]|nr:nodB [Acidimicrobiales bacterium]
VRPFTDAVVALDDGSTDDTAATLDAEPLVEVLLRNPRREGYFAWDDSRNRNRLLEAAADLDPDWIISLDADERIDAEDASVLRRFVDEEADPTRAYGFRVYRMIGDTDHYDRIEMVVYRLFAFHEGQVFRDDRLHFYPVPTSIPTTRWQQTTVRIQHLSALTEERRRARWQKYLQTDPANEWDVDYTYALVPPGVVKPWPARPAGLAVVAEGSVPEWDLADLDLEAPPISVLVLRGPADEGDVLSLVGTLVDTDSEDAAEVLLVDTTDDGTAELVQRRHPSMVVHSLDPRVSAGQARDLGLRAARGDFVLVLRPDASVEPGALGTLGAAHDEGAGLVTGTVLAAPRTPGGWAAYFIDHAASLPGGPAGPLDVAPAASSYPVSPLIALGLGRGIGALPPANLLFAGGFDAVRIPGVVSLDDAPRDLRTRPFLRERFHRGRAVEQTVQRIDSDSRRPARQGLLAAGPRLSLIERSIAAGPGDIGAAYRRVAPLVRAGLGAMRAGALYERMAGRAGAASRTRRRRPASWSSLPADPGGRGGPVRVLPPAAGMAVALTFDDGPLVGMTDAVLDELAEVRVPATFFVVGSFAERCPELVWRAVAEGHSIGVHGWDHTRLSGARPAARDQLERSLAAIRAAGAEAHLFRPPYGVWDSGLVAVAASLGLTTVTWSVNPEDWRTPGTDAIVDRVRAKVRPGSVVLLHDGRGDRAQTVAALGPIVAEVRARGLTVVDLAAALGKPTTLVASSPPK